MFVKDSGSVVFENFFKHLVKEHPEYLFENDLPARPIECPSPSFINPVETHTREVTRFFSSTDTKLREKLLECTARVIAHGPYPLDMIHNPAVSAYLTELGVTPQGFKYPSRRTVTRRTDLFLEKESADEVAEFTKRVDFFCAGWDDWTSKQNLNYMSLNLTSIPPDFSQLLNFMVACSHFPYPHEMPDIRRKVLELTRQVLPGYEDAVVTEPFAGPFATVLLQKLKALTYDGAKANYCFSPDPRASNINAGERSLRRAVNELYKKQAEMRCLCHRMVKVMEHCYDDDGNEASDIFKEIMENIFSFFNMISGSQKNEQEYAEYKKKILKELVRSKVMLASLRLDGTTMPDAYAEHFIC